jgi:hypothetical protein
VSDRRMTVLVSDTSSNLAHARLLCGNSPDALGEPDGSTHFGPADIGALQCESIPMISVAQLTSARRSEFNSAACCCG